MRALPLITLLVFSGAGVAAAQDASTQAETEAPIVTEARTLMETYAAVLSAGDRPGIADLYSRDGAWLFWEGQGAFRTHDDITRRYAEQWMPPAAFEWRGLTFIPTGVDAITVAGGFLWTAPDEAPQPALYHGQFIREDGRLRIGIEHEGLIPAQ